MVEENTGEVSLTKRLKKLNINMPKNKKQQKTPLITYYTINRERILAKYRSRKHCPECGKNYAFSYFNKHLCIPIQT